MSSTPPRIRCTAARSRAKCSAPAVRLSLSNPEYAERKNSECASVQITCACLARIEREYSFEPGRMKAFRWVRANTSEKARHDPHRDAHGRLDPPVGSRAAHLAPVRHGPV